MAKRSKVRSAARIARPPKKINLNRYVDFEAEAERFELPPARVAEIASEVANAAPPVLEYKITQVKSESELRERLEEIYNCEAQKFRTCTWDGCQEEISDIHQMIAHHRLHLLTGAPDFRVRVAVLRDIERTLVPTIEETRSAVGALPAPERTRLAKLLQTKGLLPAELINIK